MADWLCDIVTGTLTSPEPATKTGSPAPTPPPLDQGPDGSLIPPKESRDEREDSFSEAPSDKKPARPGGGLKRHYSRPTYPLPESISQTDLSPSSASHRRSVLHPSPSPLPKGFLESKTGMGRLVTFREKQPLTHLIERIARGVGNPRVWYSPLRPFSQGLCPGQMADRAIGFPCCDTTRQAGRGHYDPNRGDLCRLRRKCP